MTFTNQKQFTKKGTDDALTELIDYQGEDQISEIVRLGIQSLMNLPHFLRQQMKYRGCCMP
jgi:hypothetical protein